MTQVVWEFKHSVTCHINKSLVWSFWTDVTNWQQIEGEAVEWIRLEGPFSKGTPGATKVVGQDPQHWRIQDVDEEKSATIAIPVADATLLNKMTFKENRNGDTLITQHFTLTGSTSPEVKEGIRMFESTAPQGLAKLARTIESTHK